jgi:hypothetical protein
MKAHSVDFPQIAELALPWRHALSLMGGTEDYTRLVDMLAVEEGQFVLDTTKQPTDVEAVDV